MIIILNWYHIIYVPLLVYWWTVVVCFWWLFAPNKELIVFVLCLITRRKAHNLVCLYEYYLFIKFKSMFNFRFDSFIMGWFHNLHLHTTSPSSLLSPLLPPPPPFLLPLSSPLPSLLPSPSSLPPSPSLFITGTWFALESGTQER